MTQSYDILILGAGAAGMPAAIFAAQAGAHVLVVEVADRIGGSFHLSSGQMAAAGTRLQAAKGIHDTPDMHYDDVMHISRGTANPVIVRLAVDHAAATFDWLGDCGFAPLPEHPVITYGHEPYRTARTYWAEDGGRAVLRALVPPYEAAEKSGHIETWVDSELVRLTVDDGGAVTGAVVRRAGAGGAAHVAVAAGKVILATGGYTANAELFSALSLGKPLWGGGYPYGQGAGLLAAVEAGGEIVNQDTFLPGFAGVEDPDANGGYTAATETAPQVRQPWELFVGIDGTRAMREDDPSIDIRERALRDLPEMTFWAIWDEAIADAAPPFFTIPAETAAARFGAIAGYCKADTLADLAARTGLPEAALTATIAAYNDAIASGAPDPMGREHRPLPIAQGPFYAVRHVGWSITAFAGLNIDGELRVLDKTGQPIPNLYAAGEILGLGSTCGNSFAGGMSVTPAMTFGRLLGIRLGQAAA